LTNCAPAPVGKALSQHDLPAHCQVYLVGGAVRDQLIRQSIQHPSGSMDAYRHLDAGDQDYVVVGATAEIMMAAGYIPVGKDFPVFIHPQSGHEYALARTERKTAAGYHGFSFYAEPSVTLEEDLARRDLTVNAMAQGAAGEIIDPFNGRDDLHARVLRHVGPAFAEDPVRILRIARFAARFADFTVAPETNELMQTMVARGEVDALVPERIWKEISRGLMEQQPQRMFAVLRECKALERIFPELNRLWGVPQPAQHHPEIDTGVHTMMVLQQAVLLSSELTVRYAALTHDLGKGLTPHDLLPKHTLHEQRSVDLLKALNLRWRVPRDCAELAILVAAEHANVHRCETISPAALVRLLERCDAFRRPERFAHALIACEADARGRLGLESRPYPQRDLLLKALEIALTVNAGEIASQQTDTSAIAAAIHEARVQAIRHME
jgi:tRNA nucleotidyltransferase (CCA-adding enzyme)